MIPDKIYLHRTFHLGMLSVTEIDITGQDEQYIRKDALLEWAKEHKRVIETHGDERDAYLYPYKYLVDEDYAERISEEVIDFSKL